MLFKLETPLEEYEPGDEFIGLGVTQATESKPNARAPVFVPGSTEFRTAENVLLMLAGRVMLDLQLVTCNVNSFKDHSVENNISWTGRAELISQQAIETASHCVMWQETRKRFVGTWLSQHFIGFEAAADQGRGGVASWFRRDLPFASLHHGAAREYLYFRECDFTVLFAHSELLILRYRTDVWKAIFVSGHAPNDVADQQVKDSFWQMLDAQLSSYTLILLGIDANARVGHDPPCGIGTFAGDFPNDNGYRFQAFVAQHRLSLPSTFESAALHPFEDQGTWLSKGGWKRIDYVALPLDWIDSAMLAAWTTYIEKDVIKDDHKAACVRVYLSLPSQQHPVTRSPHISLRLNQAQMAAPEARKRCPKILHQTVQNHPGYDAPAGVQAAYISEAAHQRLKDAFPPQTRAPKPSWITDWATVSQSRHLRRLREVSQAWKQPEVIRPSYSSWLRNHDLETALALHALHQCRLHCSHGLRADEAAFLTQCAHTRFAELNEAKGTEFWKKLRYTLPKYRKRRRKTLPMHETHSTLMQHFANIEDAQLNDAPALQQSSEQHSVSALGPRSSCSHASCINGASVNL